LSRFGDLDINQVIERVATSLSRLSKVNSFIRTIDAEVSPAFCKSEIATSNSQLAFLALVFIANAECCTEKLNVLLDSTNAGRLLLAF
jgi:hypothetical protein